MDVMKMLCILMTSARPSLPRPFPRVKLTRTLELHMQRERGSSVID